MRFPGTLAVLTVLMMFVVSAHAHYVQRKWAERPVGEVPPPPEYQSLRTALRDAEDLTYSDFVKKLTAVKDDSMGACFIADLDPGLTLAPEEKAKIAAEESAKQISLSSLFREFYWVK
ncbi:uncharacterized protein LOC106012011 [Aplysia californica]|uniref:Uncharacterized protein LOC106012011 n=1 Tax=Aplysia californica TaxID=6500 RepID=A0ABM1A1P3_APLCA|nr:uncharacterized protein LOC106012011 [Aplysia californica]